MNERERIFPPFLFILSDRWKNRNAIDGEKFVNAFKIPFLGQILAPRLKNRNEKDNWNKFYDNTVDGFRCVEEDGNRFRHGSQKFERKLGREAGREDSPGVENTPDVFARIVIQPDWFTRREAMYRAATCRRENCFTNARLVTGVGVLLRRLSYLHLHLLLLLLHLHESKRSDGWTSRRFQTRCIFRG